MKRSTENEKEKSKTNNITFTILAFLTALIIMGGILAGSFYFIIHNNIYGLREKYETQLITMPLLKWALPKPTDPDDPKYLNDNEMREKYTQIKTERDELIKQLEQANTEIGSLKIYKDEYEKSIKEREKEKEIIEKQLIEIDESQEEIQKLAAENNKDGFKKYFESMDKETAEKIYREIMIDEKITKEEKNIIQIYESMDESAAAKIFDEMGETKMQLVVGLLSGIKKEKASGILAEMEPSFASKVTEEIAKKIGL